MQSGFSLPSYAKINWNLRILGKRGDGFHEICTVFQTISLHATLHFVVSEETSITCDDQEIPTDEPNLILRAANVLNRGYKAGRGAKIHLEKRIPAPGGLGGGSSNAAVALIGLMRLWQLEIAPADLQSISEELGSDVPFFLHGGTALGTGRGEQIGPLRDFEENCLLLVAPDVAVPTARAFEDLRASNLTNEAVNRILRVCRLEAESLDLRHSVLINDFERTVFSAFPEILRVKETLLGLGATRALMSGSGSTVFAIFDKQETRQAALKALDHEITWRKFAVAAVSRDEYREKVYGRL